MVLFEIDPSRPPVMPFERDAPRAVDVDRVASRARTSQRVEVKTGLLQCFEGSRFVDRLQPKESSPMQIGSHSGAFAGFKQLPQSAMQKTFDHEPVV